MRACVGGNVCMRLGVTGQSRTGISGITIRGSAMRKLCVALAELRRTDWDAAQGVFLQSIAGLLTRKATQRCAQVRLIAGRKGYAKLPHATATPKRTRGLFTSAVSMRERWHKATRVFSLRKGCLPRAHPAWPNPRFCVKRCGIGTPEVKQPAWKRAAVFLQGDGRVDLSPCCRLLKIHATGVWPGGTMAAES